MPQYRLPEMSIAQMQYTPATFQGVSFTPKTRDVNILARSLAQAEERNNKAAEKQTAIDIALGDIENKLNSAEIPWFNEYKQNIQKQIQNEIDNRNYGSAIRVATKAAGSISSDTSLIGRIKANEAYKKELESVNNNNKINSVTKQRWKAQNLYSYEDIKDDAGNIVGGTEWKPSWTPVEHYAVNEIQRLAAQMTPEESKITEKTTAGSTLGTLDGKKVSNFSDAELVLGQGSTTRYNQYQRKTEENLRAVIEQLFKEHPEYKASLEQDYEDAKWLYMEADKKSRDMSLSEEERQYQANKAIMYFESISDGAGNIIYDPNKYIEQTVFPMMKHMAYNNTVTKTNDSFHYSEGALGAIHQTSINKQLAAIDLMNMTTTPGAPVSINYGNYWTGQTMNSANFNMSVADIYADQYAEMYRAGRITKEQYNALTQPQIIYGK